MKKFIPFIKKEFLQTLRDPRTRFILFLSPIIQLIVFGYVTTLDVKNIRLTTVIQKSTPELRAMLKTLQTQNYILIASDSKNIKDVDITLKKGLSDAGLIARGENLLLVVDGTNSQTARTLINIFQSYLMKETAKRLFKLKIHFNPLLRSSYYMLPGVVILVIFIVVGILGAVAMTREKERGTYELLVMTPLSGGEIVLGKMLPYTIFGFLDVLVVTLLAVILLKMPLRGNFFALFPVLLIYIWGIASISVWISSLSETQQQAMLTLFLFFLPFILLSGLFFPIESMPRLFQYIAYLNPLTHILKILRGVFIRGDTPLNYILGITDLVIFSLFFTFLASKNVRKVLD